MTFTPVGGLIQATVSGSPTNFALTPAAVGDLICLEVAQTNNNAVYANTLTSNNVTWTLAGHRLSGGAGGGLSMASAAMTSSAFLNANPASQSSSGFNVPAGAVITVVTFSQDPYQNDWAASTYPTLTDSLSSPLTWNLAANVYSNALSTISCRVALWWAVCPAAQTGMTVTVTDQVVNSQTYLPYLSLFVQVWPGANTAGPIGAVVSNSATAAGTSASATITPQATGSALVMAAALDGNPSGSATAGTGCFLGGSTPQSGGVVWLGSSATPTLTASTSAQTLSAGGVASATWQTLAFEVLAAPAGAGPKAISLFTGKVTAASPATVTIGWSGPAPTAIRVAGQEFVSSAPPWVVDVISYLDTPGTNAWPSLSPSAAPSVTTASLPGGTTGIAYSQNLTAAGGIAPLTWSVSAGTLPAGLSLAAGTGVISGTPTTAATSNFTVKVTDAISRTAVKALSIAVSSGGGGGGGGGSLVIMSPPQHPGVNYSQAYPGLTLYAQGGTPPYTWSVTSGALPSGFSLNSSTGVLSGGTLSSGAGTYSYTVQCADSASHSVTQACQLVVANETLQTFNSDATVQGFNYYGVAESAILPNNMQVVTDLPEGTGWTPGTGQVLQQCTTNVYDPGNWWVNCLTTGPGSGQSPSNSGQIVAGPEVRQVWYYGGYGYSYEPPLLPSGSWPGFSSITTSYSHVIPTPNGIVWPTEGAELYEFTYDIWLNSFNTEIMIWTHTVGPRYPWGNSPGTQNSGGYGNASSYPTAGNTVVNIPTAPGYNPYYGTLVTIPCGPNGADMNFAFCYNIGVTEDGSPSHLPTCTYNSSTHVYVPRGPFNFIQCNSTGTAFNNTDSGFINLWGPNGASGTGLINWLYNNGFVGGTCPAGFPVNSNYILGGTSYGGGGPGNYHLTLNSINYGVEICGTGGTDFPELPFQVSSHTVNTDVTWSGQVTAPI